MKRLLELLIQGILGATFIVFFAYLMLEWAMGCGEAYVDAKGKTHVGECIVTITKKDTN